MEPTSTSSVATDDPIAALIDGLAETSALGVLFSEAVADRVGIAPSDLEALDFLRREGPMTAGRLAELTGLTTGAITGVLDRLERRGYARRRPDRTDRRRVIAEAVMEVALRDMGPWYAGLEEASRRMLDDFSDADIRLLLEFTRRARSMMVEQIARVRRGLPNDPPSGDGG